MSSGENHIGGGTRHVEVVAGDRLSLVELSCCRSQLYNVRMTVCLWSKLFQVKSILITIKNTPRRPQQLETQSQPIPSIHPSVHPLVSFSYHTRNSYISNQIHLFALSFFSLPCGGLRTSLVPFQIGYQLQSGPSRRV